jgi:hypothetical protein
MASASERIAPSWLTIEDVRFVPSLSWVAQNGEFVARWPDEGHPPEVHELRLTHTAYDMLLGDPIDPYVAWQVEVVPGRYLMHEVMADALFGDVMETSDFVSLRGALQAAERYVYLEKGHSKAKGRLPRRIAYFLAAAIGLHLVQDWWFARRLRSYYRVPAVLDVERMLEPLVLRATPVEHTSADQEGNLIERT